MKQSDFDQYEAKRQALVMETNMSVINPFNPEVFKKTRQDKMDLKKAKSIYVSLRENAGEFRKTRDELMKIIVNGNPRWGSASIALS
jgi:hypothetical protein